MNLSFESLSQTKNLRLLFILRNIAITAQVVSVLVAYLILNLDIAIMPMLFVIGMLIVLNLFTGYRLKYTSTKKLLGENEVFIQLLIDVLGLFLLIYFSGGISNPFIGFFILQVVIAAILLKQLQTWCIVTITGCAYLFLSYESYDVSGLSHNVHSGHAGHESMNQFDLHLHGMFLGYIIVAVLVAFFVVRMANNLRERDQEIYRIQQQATSETEVMKLGMMAAGAAHELGTPLNAIQLATDELKAALKHEADVQPTLDLLSRQVSRCCDSVNDLMTVVRQPRALDASSVVINQFLADTAEQWNHLNPQTALVTQLDATQGKLMVADKLLSQSLINLFDNGARVSGQPLTLLTAVDESMVHIIIEDDGPGMPDGVKHTLKNNLPITDQYGNTRLGLFLVNTLVQRMGGNLDFKRSIEGKSQVILSIPDVETGETE
jgi:two-component system sensor histidine kinase RegB